MARAIVSVAVLVLVALAILAQGDDGPQPPLATPGEGSQPPSDAIVLFNGKDTTGWVTHDGQQARCEVEEGVMVCASGVGSIFTSHQFTDAQIHLEFNIPPMPDQQGQLRGNSGVYLQGRYEIQVLDSYQNPTYAHGSLGGLYGQAGPLVNAARPPGQWQSYDIVFHAPRCDAEGKVHEKATVSVLLNGILVQDHVEIGASNSCEPGPLLLQDHSGFPGAPATTMRFRNLWLRPLTAKPILVEP